MVQPIVSLRKRLRSYIVARMHIGRLRPGDKLPSYRELSEKWGVDHRMIARGYRALEQEGLLEIRGRLGVFLKEQERIGGKLPSETAQWVASDVLMEAWQRRIKIPELPDLIRKCTASVTLRTACLEASEDVRYLLCRELHQWFGFQTVGVPVDRLPERDRDASAAAMRIDELPAAVREADLLVSTTFHAHDVRPVAELLQKPLVIVSMHPVAAEAFLGRVREGPLAVVCVDPRFGDRMRSIAGPEYESHIQVVLAGNARAAAELDPSEPAFVTTAARAQLDRHPPSLVEGVPAFSPESAAELGLLLIRLNLEKAPSAR